MTVISKYKRWNNRDFQPLDASCVPDFPVFGDQTLYSYTLGSYQIARAEGYYGEHISDNGRFLIQVLKQPEGIDLTGTDLSAEEPYLVRARIQSRHQLNTKYHDYLLYDKMNPQFHIKYCCTCKDGAETIGCCCHIATIMWFLGYARHQEHISPPRAPMHLNTIEDWTDDDD